MFLVARFGMGRVGKFVAYAPPMPSSTGPGPSTLAYGDTNMGFFGEISEADFITPFELLRMVGMYSGELSNSPVNWLKFILDGKILFVPKKPIRSNVSWQDVYQAGAVYGDDTFGTFPSGNNRLQNAAASIQGSQFKVRLLKGVAGENTPYDYQKGIGVGYDDKATFDSEWNRLFYPLSVTVVPSYTGPKWNLYTDSELGNDIGYTLCREKVNVGTLYRVLRGLWSISYLNRALDTDRYATNCWRPCLMLQ